MDESPPASRSEVKLSHVLQWAAHTWSSCPSVSVPLAEKPFLSPGLTATTGLSAPQHMGPHMLTFMHSCFDEAHTPSELTPNYDALPFTHDSFRRFENASFLSSICVIASLISPLVLKMKLNLTTTV